MKITTPLIEQTLTNLRKLMSTAGTIPADIDARIKAVPLRELTNEEASIIHTVMGYSTDPNLIDNDNNIAKYEMIIEREDGETGYSKGGIYVGNLNQVVIDDAGYLYLKDSSNSEKVYSFKFEDIRGICSGVAYVSEANNFVLGVDLQPKNTNTLLGDDLEFRLPTEKDIPYILKIK